MNSFTLYLVKSKVRNIFLNRTYSNLIYGKFLKEYADVVEIMYFKVPSNTYKVNYKKLIDYLYSLNWTRMKRKIRKIR